ncbi:MAG: DUF294 nucleotidyltransferase-like domain-containing protein [Nitrospiraceae bacterium]|nr:DUF294 nucleotidyltransferase-like domain-containing protein [Nitrospiraceae bacterium]
MILEEVVEFLKKVPPFQFLEDTELKKIAAGVSMEYYPSGSTILYQEGPASEYLRVIKKGGVKVFIRSADNEEVVIDYRGEGDVFGLLSMVKGDRSIANVIAVEDTISYLIDKQTILALLDTHPSVTEFFLKSFLNKYIDKTYKEMHNKSLLYGGGDKLLFTTPIGELSNRKVITAPNDITIKEASEIMSKHKIGSLVLVTTEGVPVGIVTNRDFRDKVVSKGRQVTDSVTSIMSSSLIKAEARDYCFEALLKMLRYNIHHVLVVDEGKLKGIITNHDLMMLQGISPISIVKELESQQTIEGLIPVSKKINKIVSLLLKEGAKASNITRIISEINDRLVKKIIDITERELGKPPVNYCWIVFGSEGRKEQTFKTDQDNAIIYDDTDTKEEAEKAKVYFSVFASHIRDGLLKCGFPLCPANYMATNPQWCQPLKVWKKYFSNWVSEPVQDSILKSLIFFDFRPLYGEISFAEKLRDHLIIILKDQKVFLGYLANVIIKNMPPVGFLKSFVVEKSGEHKDMLNLKIKGVSMLVDIVRLFSLERGIRETSTLERLNVLKNSHTTAKEYAEEIEHAFEFIMLLRIQHQLEQIQSGSDPDNFIDPKKLSNLEKKTMKEAFHLVSKIQDSIIERYKSLIW